MQHQFRRALRWIATRRRGPEDPVAEPPSRAHDRPVYELIALARQAVRGDDAYWAAVTMLQDRGTHDVSAAASTLCESSDPSERALGVDILAQGRTAQKTSHDEAVDILLRLLDREADPAVLASIGYALGHRHDARSIGPLARWKDHPSAEVRQGVVMGLLAHDDDVAVDALIGLSSDVDRDVRDWATFGLGSQIDRDSPDVRDALARRLIDQDEDTRLEAIVGLARRRDERALAPLLNELAADDVPMVAIEAAEAMGDPRLCPALLRLQALRQDSLGAAMDACGCSARPGMD